MTRFVVVGTDTGVGKTVFSATLAGALGAYYWKPVQAGLGEETDSQTVARLSGLPAERILPEAFRLRTPASPHLAARLDGVAIDPAALTPPDARPLVVETAGGVMVPLTLDTTFADVLARWDLPAILVARTCLGTINHSLLSIEALRRRSIRLHGVAFVGAENVESRRAIATMGRVTDLGRLPPLSELTPRALAAAFAEGFAGASWTAQRGPGAAGPVSESRRADMSHATHALNITRLAGDDPLAFDVVVQDGSGETRHHVTLSRADHARLSPAAGPQKTIEAAFRFLLDHEPKESILPRFDIAMIDKYFPQFEHEFPRYLESRE